MECFDETGKYEMKKRTGLFIRTGKYFYIT